MLRLCALTLFLRHVAYVTWLALAFCVSALRAETITLEVSPEQLSALPRWAEILATESGRSYRIDLGQHFQEELLTGKIDLANNLTGQAKVGALRSSCGCAAARISKDTVSPNEKQAIILQVKKTVVGKYSEQIEFQFGDTLRRVEVIGEVKPRKNSQQFKTKKVVNLAKTELSINALWKVIVYANS